MPKKQKTHIVVVVEVAMFVVSVVVEALFVVTGHIIFSCGQYMFI